MSNGPDGSNTGSNKKSRDWCFTLNNAEDEWEFPADPSTTYYIYQREIGENGTPHVQGFVQFKNPRAMGGLKKLIPRAHWESRRGTAQEASDYCEKNDSRQEGCAPIKWGIIKKGDRAGKRNDLNAFKESAQRGVKRKEMLEEHSEVLAKYPQFAKEYMELYGGNQIETMVDVILRPWQRQGKLILDGPIDERAIFWFYDQNGGKGKSFFAKWLMQTYDTFYCRGGKGNDILYAYSGQRVVIFDYTRETEQYVGYGVMEALKDGVYFSSKYQSAMKTWKQPHVFVFANFELDRTKLSSDRINVIKFHEDGSAWWEKPNTPIKELFESDDLIEYANREIIELE